MGSDIRPGAIRHRRFHVSEADWCPACRALGTQVFHMEYRVETCSTASDAEGRVGEGRERPGEEWVKRIGGEDVPWVKRG